MANIEETIFDEGLPVNSIAMAKRLIEILKANKTNGYSALPDKDKARYKMCLWLINQQVYGQTGIIHLYNEWEELRILWKGRPKSICTCGHTGDGPNSQHADRYGLGHGACKVEGCNCKQFTWDKFIEKGKDVLSHYHSE